MKPVIAASWDEGLRVLAEAESSGDLGVIIPVRLQLFSAFREGEIFGDECYNEGTAYQVLDPDDKNRKITRYSRPSLKPLTKRMVDLKKNQILLHGKGGTFVYQPIDSETARLLAIHFRRVRGEDRPLFPMTTRNWRKIVKNLAANAGVDHVQYFSSHTLRAISITYVCHAKDRGKAQHHARHRSPATTAKYDRPTDEMRDETFREIFDNPKTNSSRKKR